MFLIFLIIYLNISSVYSAISPFSVDLTCTSEDSTVYEFDTASLECNTCGTNQVLDDNNQCTCDIGYLIDIDNEDPSIFSCDDTCLASDGAAYSDGSACVSCDGILAVFDSDAQDCVCTDSDSIVVEFDVAGNRLGIKSCASCPDNSYVDPNDPYKCIACSDENMEISDAGACVCSDGFTTHYENCLLNSYATAIVSSFSSDSAKLITFDLIRNSDVESQYSSTVDSYTFDYYYLSAAVNCRYYKERDACHTLTNLCAATIFNPNAIVCTLLKQIQTETTTTVHSVDSWKTGLPLIEYFDDTELTSTNLKSSLVFELSSTNTDRSTIDQVLFKLAKYAYNGTFIGFEDLTNQLQLCDNSNMDRWTNIGTNYENSCNYDLNNLLTETNEQYFYELYYIDQDNLYLPIPIKILNYKNDQNNYPNVKSNGQENFNEGNLILHRRFFLYDITSGIKTENSLATIITYAQDMVLRIKMQDGSTTKIYPPILSINYAQRELSSIQDTSSSSIYSTINFQVEYRKSDQAIRNARTGLFITFFIIGFFMFLLRTIIWLKTNLIVTLDSSFIGRMIIFLYASLSDSFFWTVFFLDFYAFIFFKGQDTIHFLLPHQHSDLYTEHSTFITIAFFGKLLDLIYRLWKQTYNDIFFIDWEKPKNISIDEEDHDDDEISDESSVSVWRKLMVVNIWNDLQTERLIDIHLTLFGIIFVLFGLKLENMATHQPNMSDLTNNSAPINPVLRFCISTLSWIIIAGGQLIYQKFIYQRYLEHKSGQFVDLLNLTNISVFIFDERYRCYYLHGQSVSKYADVSLEHIFENLKAYQNSATQSRGLDNTNIDTWIIYTSKKLRLKYDHEYNELVAHQMLAKQQIERRRGIGGYSRKDEVQRRARQQRGKNLYNNSSSNTNDHIIKANLKLDKFLQDFVSNHNSKYPRNIEHRSTFEDRLNIPPISHTSTSRTSLFYPDLSLSFINATLMGIEYELIIFYALLHGVCDLLWNNSIVSLLVVYIVDRFIVFSRRHWGKINISKKTLVDYRFLI